MSNFSLIQAVENIYYERTRSYFQEIKSSYENGNYRSAIVSLYSVVICDILYKLIDLKDIFLDEKANKILDEIEKMQKANPKSPDWENKLIEYVSDRTQLISPSLLTNIKNLQNIRHLSAHPVLVQNYELYSPNRESVIALIRIILEELFTRPPLVSKGIFDKLLEDISKNNKALYEYHEMENFLKARYLNHTTPEIKGYIFKSLWRITFKIEDEECDTNRKVNTRALRVIYDTEPSLYFELIKREIKYFSQISYEKPLKPFLFFLGLHPEIYQLLESDTKNLIKTSTKQNKSNKLSAWFLSKDLKKHIQWIKLNQQEIELVAPNEFFPIYEAAIDNGVKREFFELVIQIYTTIEKKRDDYYTRLDTLRNYMHEFDKELLSYLLSSINSNRYLCDSIYGLVNQDLLERMRDIQQDDSFGNQKDYPNFFMHLKE